MKTVKITKHIESILNVTKNVIKQSSEFNEYYQNKDNNLYQSQLPLLMQRARLREALYFKNNEHAQGLILHKTVNEEQDTDNILKEEEEKNINNKFSLTGIRKLQVRSKKLPPLCPFYNKKGELLPEVVSTAKALNNMESDSKFNMSNMSLGLFPNFNWHFLTPMNKNKIKNINLYENIEIHFDDFQKEVLFENKYDSLKYDYTEIFGRKSVYKEYIKNYIEDVIKLTSEAQLIEEGNKIIENKETKKEKIFEWGKNKNNIHLILNSLNIKITDPENNNIVFEYSLPLNLVHLFYYKGFEKFKIFIMALIHWDEKNKKFELEPNIYTTINNLLTNCRDLKTKFDIFDDIEVKEDNIQQMPELKRAVTFGKGSQNKKHNLAKSMMNMGSNASNHLFAGTNVDIIQKRKIKKTNFKIFPKEEKPDFCLNFNTFNFYWKTSDHLYNVSIETPLIIFKIPSHNIIIKQFIDFELLFYLFQINFENWDFYVIKYISSFKIFRIILSQMTSFNQKKNINIFLENAKIKNYDFSDGKIINIFSSESISDLIKSNPKKIDNNNNPTNFAKIEEDEKEHDDDILEEGAKKESNTLQTEETIKSMNITNYKAKKGMNALLEQKCFKAIVTVNDLDKYIANEYEIHFNYKQFSKFKFIEKYMNKISFLIKFLDINYENSSIKFDYDSLNTFNEKAWLFQLEKYNINCNFNSITDTNNSIQRPKTENISTKIIKKTKNKKIANNLMKLKEIKKDEDTQNLNINNKNRAEFGGDSSKNSLVIEIKEPVIFLKCLQNDGKVIFKKFNVVEEDENKLIISKKNLVNVIQNICDLTQDYIKKEKEKKVEIAKTSEKNLYYSFNKKLVK